MKRPIVTGLAALAVCAAGGVGIANAAGGSDSPSSAPAAAGSRLDDGKDLLSQAKITEQQAIAAAQKAASGDLDEVDLEHYDGKLVFNVDVGSKDVKVDAGNGDVLNASSTD